MTGTHGGIAGIGVGTATTTATHGVTALIPDLAAHADGITDTTETTPTQTLEKAVTVTENDDATTLKTGSIAQVAGGTVHKSANQDRTAMIHTETGTTVATDIPIRMAEKSVRAGVRLVLIESATMLRKTIKGRLNRHGSWLPCSRLPPTLTATERPDWRLWRIANVPLERPMTRRENEGEIVDSSMACIGKR